MTGTAPGVARVGVPRAPVGADRATVKTSVTVVLVAPRGYGRATIGRLRRGTCTRSRHASSARNGDGVAPLARIEAATGDVLRLRSAGLPAVEAETKTKVAGVAPTHGVA